jgi:hypothetical protein
METEAQAIYLLCLPSAHHAIGSLLFVRLLTKKQTGVIQLQTDETQASHLRIRATYEEEKMYIKAAQRKI